MNPFEEMEIMLKDDYDFCAESCGLQGAINNLAECIEYMNIYGHNVDITNLWQQQLEYFSQLDKSKIKISSAATRTE